MAKQNVRASLVIYARIPELGGWRRGSLIISKTGYRPDAMFFNGVVYTTLLNSTFQIRTYNGSKAQYKSVGSDLAVAQKLLKETQATRQIEAGQEALGIIKVKAETLKTMAEFVREYIGKKKSLSLGLSTTSIRHYEESLLLFVKLTKRELPSQVTENDVINYCDHLQREGYSAKTRKMRYTAVRGFLRSCGVIVEKVVDAATHKRLSPKIDPITDPYDPADLEKLYAACDEYHTLVYKFLLMTGLRFREANHLPWSNIDFARNMITLPAEQSVNRRYHSRKAGKMVTTAVESKTKSRKSREIPLFASLRPLLLQWREQNSSDSNAQAARCRAFRASL